MPAIHAHRSSAGVDWDVDLERDDLLPGQTAKGRLRLTARGNVEARFLIAALIATEQWQYTDTVTDAKGNSHTETRTRTVEHQRLPVDLGHGVVHLSSGETREMPFEVPVPPLGPATLDATVSRLTWELEIKLDIPGGFDSAIVLPVRVLQPTALLRAGVVDVGEFALYPAADAATGEGRATIQLDPMPLCLGAPFSGTLTIDTAGAMKLQEVRLELRVHVEATVHSGRREDITVWVGQLAGEGEFGGASRTIPFRAELPGRDLSTMELPHGRTNATLHVILARAWMPDPHLVRDVALCTTTEI
jgi:hypothetical protein